MANGYEFVFTGCRQKIEVNVKVYARVVRMSGRSASEGSMQVAAPPPFLALKFYFGGESNRQNLAMQSFKGSRFKADTWMEAFGPRYMTEFTPTIITMFEAQLTKLSAEPRSNIQELLHALTIQVVWTRMIGHIPDEDTQLLPIMQAMSDFTEDVTALPLPRLNLFNVETKLDRAKKVLADITLSTVAQETF